MEEYPLYMKDNKYYLLIDRAINYNIAVEFITYNNKFISNNELKNDYILVEFNENNLKILLKNIFNNIVYNELSEFNYIIYYEKIYKLNNWLDVFNFSAGRF